MLKRLLLKSFVFSLITSVGIFSFMSANIKVEALSVIPSNIYNIDQSLVGQEDNFNLPDSVYIVPVILEADVSIEDSEWYEGAFYYEASRLNQMDFLSHYYISKDGQVLQGNHKGDEQRFNLLETTDRPIIVTYFSQRDQTDFPTEVRTVIKDVILNLVNLNAIKLERIYLKSEEFVLSKGAPVAQKFTPVNGKMELTLREIVKEILPNYAPISKNYQLAVESIDLPDGQVSYGQIVDVGITVKNNSNVVLYQGTDYEPIISKLQNVSSMFYYNGIWLSQTQAPFMTEGSMIKPGESKKFNIKLNIPLYFGAQKEQFQLINSIGNPYLGTIFDISLDIKRTDQPVVEITQTETGQLNVREGPWYSSAVVGKVTPGQRFIVLERTDSGYLKLDLGNGKTGWVVSKYTKTL